MDSLAALKRRAAELFEQLSLPRSLPSLPSLPYQASSQQPYRLKGTWERISVPPLARTGHSVDVVAGAAYIFGGETGSRKGPDNVVHAVILPSSGAQADCYTIQPKAASPEPKVTVEDDGPSSTTELPPLGDVPAPRVGHATAVIGSRIFLFGGKSSSDAEEPLDEQGRVWVFDTRTHLWASLDPELTPSPTVEPDSDGAPGSPTRPAPRSFHSAVASDKPDHVDEQRAGRRRAKAPATQVESWRQWALGDSDEVGIPQRPIIGNVASRATDADSEGYGTLIIHGGYTQDNSSLASDTWAFDVRSRVWRELPSAPGEPRSGAALSISGSRLYRFGGSVESTSAASADLDVLELAAEATTAGAAVAARGAWRTIQPEREQQEQQKNKATAVSGEDLESGAAVPLNPNTAEEAWPAPRIGASLEALRAGGGWEYLVLSHGAGEGSPSAEAAPLLDDVWVFQVPPEGLSAAGVHRAFLNTIGRGGKGGEAGWTRVEPRPFDEDDEDSVAGPAPRAHAASAAVGEPENAVLVWGGADRAGKRLGDGWILRLD